MSKPIIELAIEIIAATHDGDDLAPHHLKLVELAVNGYLSEQGEVAFNELVENVRAGYQKPWFHDIEHFTIDHEGFVYWKEKQVEHYTPRWAYSEDAQRQAQELARRCLHLEAIGVQVNAATTIGHWELYADRRASDPDKDGHTR
jgi:hypothetical protein